MQLRPEDLRIGNTVHYFSEGEYSENTIDWQDLQWLDEDPKGFNMVHFPIPLTEDILLRLGFEKDYEDDYMMSINGRLYYYKDGFLKKDYKVKIKLNQFKIEFLHELQNLFIDLAKTELKLNEQWKDTK